MLPFMSSYRLWTLEHPVTKIALKLGWLMLSRVYLQASQVASPVITVLALVLVICRVLLQFVFPQFPVCVEALATLWACQDSALVNSQNVALQP